MLETGLGTVLMGGLALAVAGLIGWRWWRRAGQQGLLAAWSRFARQHDLDFVAGSLQVGDKPPQVYGLYQGRGVNVTLGESLAVGPQTQRYELTKVMVALKGNVGSGRFWLVQDGKLSTPFREVRQPNAAVVTVPGLDGALTMSAPEDLLGRLWVDETLRARVKAVQALAGFVGLMVQSQSVYALVVGSRSSEAELAELLDRVSEVAAVLEARWAKV